MFLILEAFVDPALDCLIDLSNPLHEDVLLLMLLLSSRRPFAAGVGACLDIVSLDFGHTWHCKGELRAGCRAGWRIWLML